MAYVGSGLITLVVGLVLVLGSDSPGVLVRSEQFGLLLVACGAVATLVGIVTRVHQVHRVDRSRV